MNPVWQGITSRSGNTLGDFTHYILFNNYGDTEKIAIYFAKLICMGLTILEFLLTVEIQISSLRGGKCS